MPGPPPPPPPGPPPPPVASSAPPVAGKDALLKSIQKGAKLKKVQTNDRSAPTVDAKPSGPGAPRSPPMPRPGGGGGGGLGAAAAGPPGLGGLFAGGMPKLKSTGLKPGGGGSGSGNANESAPAPAVRFTPPRSSPAPAAAAPVPVFPKPKTVAPPPAPPRSAPPTPARGTSPPPAPARHGPPPMPVRSTSPPAPVRHAPPPPPPRGGGSGPTSPNMPRFTPPAPASRPAPPVPDRSSNATSRPAPPVPNRTGNLTPSGTVRGAPPPLPGVRAAFDKPPSVPTGLPARSTPPAPPGRPSTSISRGSTVNGSAMKSSFSSNSISSIDRRGSDGPYETDANGRWKFRTDLPPPRRFPTGEPYPNGPSAAANATASPSMSKRPPPPPPARRVSRAPPPPPSRSREGSVNQSAEVTRYVEDTVPKLEKELSASVARADFMRCQKLKDTIDSLNALSNKAQGGTTAILLMDELKRLRSEVDAVM